VSVSVLTPSPVELQAVSAARELAAARSVLIGVGRPGTPALLAKAVHNPELALIYESGAIGAKPRRIPLSIGDGELALTADAVVALPEMFNYWIAMQRIDVALLGAAQVDRFGNLNSTVIGSYEHPKVRLPGAGGAPEIATGCREIVVIAPHDPRTLVAQLDFRTTFGFGAGGDDRTERGLGGRGPVAVVTDLGVLRPAPGSHELTLVEIHPGVSIEQVRESTGWPLAVAEQVRPIEPPNADELDTLRNLLEEG
jgi:glutaconate CoA-transferase, subunit B